MNGTGGNQAASVAGTGDHQAASVAGFGDHPSASVAGSGEHFVDRITLPGGVVAGGQVIFLTIRKSEHFVDRIDLRWKFSSLKRAPVAVIFGRGASLAADS